MRPTARYRPGERSYSVESKEARQEQRRQLTQQRKGEAPPKDTHDADGACEPECTQTTATEADTTAKLMAPSPKFVPRRHTHEPTADGATPAVDVYGPKLTGIPKDPSTDQPEPRTNSGAALGNAPGGTANDDNPHTNVDLGALNAAINDAATKCDQAAASAEIKALPIIL